MDNNGWIKLHRKFLKWEWIDKPEMVSLFLHFLLMANHDTGKWQGQEIKRGQLITGRLKLSKLTGIKQGCIRECIKRLKSTNEITTNSTNKYTIITIVKYNDYQDDERKSANKQTNKPTNDQPTTNQQPTTNNNDNKNKNEKNINTLQATPAEFSFKDIKEKMLLNADKRMPIISLYWNYQKIEFKNREQYSAGIKRELRPAGNLIGYPIERIKEVMYWLNGEDWIAESWTLETVHKYIDRDLNLINEKKYEKPKRTFNQTPKEY